MWMTVIIFLIGVLTILYTWTMKKMSLFRNANVPEDPGYFPMANVAFADFSIPRWDLDL